MHTATYALVAFPLVLAVHVLLCWSLHFLSVPSIPVGHHIQIAFVAEALLLCYWLSRWLLTVASSDLRRLNFVERPPVGADKFGVPVMEEVVKFFSMILVVCLGSSTHNIRISYVYTVAGVYAFNFTVASLVEFCPVGYTSRFKKFLSNYDIYQSQMRDALEKSPSFDSSLLGGSTLTPVNSAQSFEFNTSSFGFIPLSPSVLVPNMDQQVLESSQEVLERLFSVSPKNTLHFLLGEYGMDASGPTLQAPVEVEDTGSVHSADTHFGGGGGGNFKFKLPGGAKVGFGGGAGFGYSHGSDSDTNSDKQSSHETTCSETKSDCKSLNHSLALATLDTSNTSASIAPGSPNAWNVKSMDQKKAILLRVLYWFRWLLPIPQSEDGPVCVFHRALRFSIRKKLSTFTLNTETKSLKSSLRLLYGTVDIESQLPDRQCKLSKTENVHAYYEFAKFGNKFFDVWSPGLLEFYRSVDPSFYRFGTLLSRLPVFYYVIYAASICMWQFASTLMLAYPFVVATPSVLTFLGLVAVVFVAKVFCTNYLNNQATCSYRVSLVVELAVSLILFALAYFYYLSL